MKKKILSIVQLAFGIGLVIYLLSGINQNTQLVTFSIPAATITANTVYRDDATPPNKFMAMESIQESTTLRCVHSGAPQVASSGTLTRLEGQGPATLDWSAVTSARYGLRFLRDTFRQALGNWGWLLMGAASFGLCIGLCTWRWFLLLRAQGLELPFRRVLSLYFVGQFFNAIMPGAVGGDVIKAYFAAKRTHHRRTEAVSTIVIDRLIGVLALLLLTAVIMVVFLKFFLSHPETKLALIFNACLLLGAVALLFVVFRQNVFERWAFFRRMEQRTSLGRMISRVYNAFHACLNHAGLLTQTMILSLLNHIALIGAVYLLGTALEIQLRFTDYLMVFPVINAIAAVPITPGGLGTREGACVFLLGVLHVPATSAITLSLLVYVSMLAWSLIGGLVYATYIYGKDPTDRQALQSAIEEVEIEDETGVAAPDEEPRA